MDAEPAGRTMYHDPMRRALKHMVVFGLLGAIATWAAAWMCAIFGAFAYDGTTERMGTAERAWLVSVSRGVGFTRVSAVPDNGIWAHVDAGTVRIPAWSRFHVPPSPEVVASPCSPWFIEHGHGVPFRSMVAEIGREIYDSAGVRVPSQRFAAISGIEVLDDGSVEPLPFRTLPVRIIPAGFLADTGIYGVIFWLLWFTPGAIRRMVRRQRGRCEKCGYDLRGNASGGAGSVCPECGSAG